MDYNFSSSIIIFYEWIHTEEKKTKQQQNQVYVIWKDVKMKHCISWFLFPSGMFGGNEFEESKIGAACLTMEDLCRMPFDVAGAVESEEEKVTNYRD